MVDFLKIVVRQAGKSIYICPDFIVKKSNDLMIRGRDFYAVWMEDRHLWSTDESDLIELIDNELSNFARAYKEEHGLVPPVRYMCDSSSGSIDCWHKYCQKQMRDNYHTLDQRLVWQNESPKKKDYASKKLPYDLCAGNIEAFDQLISVLYLPEERRKIEWAIGSIVTGQSAFVQKFLVLYGAAGTGKSTILRIIEKLFDGYCATFDAKALGSANGTFALEPFKTNPLVAIQDDGDLSRIEDNTRLNSLVSHEQLTVNEKFKSTYASQFNAFLFMGTNKPVRITDAKSGIIRRLIDVSPTGNTIDRSTYDRLMDQIEFELGAIAYHCAQVYNENPGYYNHYIPINMMSVTNHFFDFMEESYPTFKRDDSTTLKAAYTMYKEYCDDTKVTYPMSRQAVKEELKNYFEEYYERYHGSDKNVRCYYKGFIEEKFKSTVTPLTSGQQDGENAEEELPESKFIFSQQPSIFDTICADCRAQYAADSGAPSYKWDNVTTSLRDIDTSQLHYVQLPENHIVIDFDIPDENGNKSLTRNLEACSKWPLTYAELSKSGAGIHLHYIYNGDVSKLSALYDEHIEVKVQKGNSALRRKLTKCNNAQIATLSSGLPLKGEKPVINKDVVMTENTIRKMIIRNLLKEFHPGTKPSIDFIYKILEDAYTSGVTYDVTDLYQSVLSFASKSTHQAEYCIRKVAQMHFSSADNVKSDGHWEDMAEVDLEKDVLKLPDNLIFLDVEVFPNLFLVNWKKYHQPQMYRLINPKPKDIEELFNYSIVGFNNRKYDNHMLYACYLGYSIEELYKLSGRLIPKGNGKSNRLDAGFKEAYNLSYTDVYDFCSKKQSLKKWEIELGLHHKELGLPWDQPVPKEKWTMVSEYCDNDVISTEAVFDARQGDFVARCILADLTGMTVNTPTNTLSGKLIFGDNRHPQSEFNYRNLGDTSDICDWLIMEDGTTYTNIEDPYTRFNSKGQPIFPGYSFEYDPTRKEYISTYRGVEVGEGGRVYANPGMYWDVALLDIASQHPSSAIAEQIFGPRYTKIFEDLKQARVHIKHKEFDKLADLFEGRLMKFVKDESIAKMLAQALKIVINAVYGMTSAKFDNLFRDPRNVDNIVAKRGALFMVNLQHFVEERGFTVAHIKTDSIKIPNATPEIIQAVMEYGKMYGYTFEHEATYSKMCLVNDAVYIAQYKDGEHAGEWTATGAQFAVPYVFKTLFSHEEITFDDLCETKAVTSALYLDMNEGYSDVSEVEAVYKLRLSSAAKYSRYEQNLLNRYAGYSDEELLDEIAKGHNYCFVGKVGRFTPVKPGVGGGVLVREMTDVKGNKSYSAPSGTKGYRWLESETIGRMEMGDVVDMRYYEELAADAMKAISEYGDFNYFVSGEHIDYPDAEGDYPPWEYPCGAETTSDACKTCANITKCSVFGVTA